MALLKVEWQELQAALLAVPIRQRTSAWKKGMALVSEALKLNNLAIKLAPDLMHHAVPCELCKQQIRIDDDYVFKAASGEYRHYDCFHMESAA